MASHHEKNAKSPGFADVQGPGSASSAGKLSVSYPRAEDMDTPTSPFSVNKAPDYTAGDVEVDGPNTPNPMSNTGDH